MFTPLQLLFSSLQESKTPLPAEKFVPIWEDIKDMGVLIGKGGLYGNVRIVFSTSIPQYRKRHGELRRLATFRKLEIDTRHFLRDYEQSVISVRDPRGSKMDAHPPDSADTFPWCRVRPESRERILRALWCLLKIGTELLRFKLSQNITQTKSVCGFFQDTSMMLYRHHKVSPQHEPQQES